MKAIDRIHRLELELKGRDYEGVTTFLTADVIELKLSRDKYRDLVKKVFEETDTNESWKESAREVLKNF